MTVQEAREAFKTAQQVYETAKQHKAEAYDQLVDAQRQQRASKPKGQVGRPRKEKPEDRLSDAELDARSRW